MQRRGLNTIVFHGGARGALLDAPPFDTAQTVRVRLDDGRIVSLPSSFLRSSNDGIYEVAATPDGQALESVLRPVTATATPAPDIATPNIPDPNIVEHTVVPVLAENVKVGKRSVVKGGVRVHRRIVDSQQEIDVPLQREHVEIRRVVVDREVDGPQPVREEGNTVIVPVVQEVAEVRRRFRLKEEIHITRTIIEDRHRESVTVSRQEADVERFEGMP